MSSCSSGPASVVRKTEPLDAALLERIGRRRTPTGSSPHDGRVRRRRWRRIRNTPARRETRMKTTIDPARSSIAPLQERIDRTIHGVLAAFPDAQRLSLDARRGIIVRDTAVLAG